MEDHDDHRDDHEHNHGHDHDHDQNRNVNRSSRGGPPATPRWNPTKEQINMLESLYRQGIRTPSADQIQQITTRLRAFGHIEGKNVFYWFQNHKARQRQKQKQENIAYINRFLHRSSNPTTHSTFSPTATSHHLPCPNVVCEPCYVPVPTQADSIGTLHQQYQQTIKWPVSNATMGRSTVSRTSPRLEKFSPRTLIISGGSMMNRNKNCTLSLFPLSPTSDLQKKDDKEEIIDHDNAENINTVSSEVEGSSYSGGGDQPFYDFFSR